MTVINTNERVLKQGPDVVQDTKDKRNKTPTTDNVDFDDLLSSAGEFGWYQIFLFFSTFPFYTFGVFVYFSQLFITEVSPNHWCWIPELENLTDLERRSLAVPLDENSRFGYSQCIAYDANWTEVLITGRRPDRNWSTIPCQHGWEFNRTEIPYPTISSELGWVCERDSYQATAQSIFFFGSICGGFVIGWVADKFGRLPATIVSNLIGCIAGTVSIFAKNFIDFAIYRFFMGFAYDNCMMMVYLLVLEYVAPKYRTLIANISFAVFYCLSVTALPWIAIACDNWKILALVTSLPLILAVFTPLIIPESPRWLLSKGRVDEAVNKILKICEINKKEIPIKLIERFKSTVANTKQEESKSIFEILKRRKLRIVFLIVCLLYTCCALVFDALVRSIGTLNFDFFISFSVISATEFPSMMLLAIIMDRVGRRWLSAASFIIAFVFCLLTVFIGGGLKSVICAVIARFAINMSYGASMQWAAELLPTPIRGVGISIVHVCGFIGTILSPFIVYTETIVYYLPLVIVACICLFSAVLAFNLPETACKDMPQTFDDAEELFRNQKFWGMPCLQKKQLENDGQINKCFEM